MARRQRLSHLRSKRSLARHQGRKPPRSITLIVCEGETEQAYFRAARTHYRLTTAEVVVADNNIGSAPISVVECAESKAKEKGGYDRIFCVIDRDSHESFGRARERIRSLVNRSRSPLPIREAVSIPCFEYWILLHFEYTDAPFANCDAVIVRICQRHSADYRKADDAVMQRLMPLVDTAIENAERIEANAENDSQNPYTNVHYVLQHFAQVAGQA